MFISRWDQRIKNQIVNLINLSWLNTSNLTLFTFSLERFSAIFCFCLNKLFDNITWHTFNYLYCLCNSWKNRFRTILWCCPKDVRELPCIMYGRKRCWTIWYCSTLQRMHLSPRYVYLLVIQFNLINLQMFYSDQGFHDSRWWFHER